VTDDHIPPEHFPEEPTAPPPPLADDVLAPEPPPTMGRLLELMDELITSIEEARTVPLSSNVMVARDEYLQQLYRLRDELPDELRAARWMVREREAFVARTNERARDMLEKARARSQEMISDHYIVSEAVEEANSLIRRAETDARRIRLESEDFAERSLAGAETVLGELLQQVRSARAQLHQARPATPEPPISQ